MDRAPESLDEARMLPHLRERSRLVERRRMVRAQADVLRSAVRESPSGLAPRFVASAGDDGRYDLRMVPVMGVRGVGAVIPGTHPEREAERRVDAALARLQRIAEAAA